MRLIVLGDIHGNITALEAVLMDAIESYGSHIDGFIFLGDYCCDFLEGEECIELMQKLNKKYPVYAITGNRETAMVHPYKQELDYGNRVSWNVESTMGAALLSCDRMSHNTLNYIQDMSNDLILSFDGMESLYLQHKMPLFDEKIQELKRIGCKVILTAHTHEFHDNIYDSFQLFNPGSVGLTDDGIQGACYGVLTWRNQHWRMEKRHIEYDYEKQKNLVRENSTLMEHCRHWGYTLIAAIDTGINVPALYMFEVKRIAREYARTKNKEQSSNHDISLGIGRYGNVSPYKDYLKEQLIVGDRIDSLKYATDEFDSNSANFVIEDWMYDVALKNVLESLYSLKRDKKIDKKLSEERRFR